MKKALITGASSGIGKEMARLLSNQGYYVILAARREEQLSAICQALPNPAEYFVCDVTDEKQLQAMAAQYPDIDLLVNNAGFGVFGRFAETDLQTELQMLQTNITALHILTKLYLPRMVARKSGKILNVASLAAFMAGPLMAAYYASKSYVLRLSRALSKELKGSGVQISVFCPGPVQTEFNQVAGVRFAVKPLSAEKAAKIAVQKTLRGKFLILPGITAKFSAFASKILPDSFMSSCAFHIQKKKI